MECNVGRAWKDEYNNAQTLLNYFPTYRKKHKEFLISLSDAVIDPETWNEGSVLISI